MKPTFKDYLAIALALLAIFLCGYGIGFLLGERKGLKNAPAPQPNQSAPTQTITDWKERAIRTLQESMDLTPEQLSKARDEISTSATRIEAAREQAVSPYRAAYEAELRDLHQRLKGVLTPEQWESLQKPPSIGGGGN